MQRKPTQALGEHAKSTLGLTPKPSCCEVKALITAPPSPNLMIRKLRNSQAAHDSIFQPLNYILPKQMCLHLSSCDV